MGVVIVRMCRCRLGTKHDYKVLISVIIKYNTINESKQNCHIHSND